MTEPIKGLKWLLKYYINLICPTYLGRQPLHPRDESSNEMQCPGVDSQSV